MVYYYYILFNLLNVTNYLNFRSLIPCVHINNLYTYVIANIINNSNWLTNNCRFTCTRSHCDVLQGLWHFGRHGASCDNNLNKTTE